MQEAMVQQEINNVLIVWNINIVRKHASTNPAHVLFCVEEITPAHTIKDTFA
jgi:hypothetical protein